MKYKVGDNVIIRQDLEAGNRYEYVNFIGDMNRYKGCVATIAGVRYRSNNVHKYYYSLDIDHGEFVWTSDMFEPIKCDVSYISPDDLAAILE